MQLTREEAFLTHRGRPATDIRLKIGMKRSGEITAVDAEVVQRGGAYGGYGLVTILYAGALLHALYRVGAVRYRGFRVYTNLPPCGAMRGHGAVDVRHAFESLLDEMAGQLGLDPFAVRRANLIDAPYRTLNDLQVNSYGLPACLDWVEQASGWATRRGKLAQAAGLRRGLGMACSHYVSGSAKPVHWSGEPHAVINLKLDFDGGITILTGASDIGQGSSTLLTQVVAEVLMLPLARIRVVATDSALTPKDNGSYSSRVSFMVGNAALRAAEELKRVLVAAAARKLEVTPDEIDWAGECCAVVGTDKTLNFAQVVEAALVDSGTLTVKGVWSTPQETQGGKFRGAAVGSTAGFSYAAQVVEVSVDEDTGVGHGREGVGGARLRLRHQPAGRRGPGAGRRVDGHGPGAERGDAVPRGPAAAAELARLPHPDDRRVAADRGQADREHGPARPLRRQGGERRRAARLPAGADQRHLRRHRHPPARAAGHARPRARGDPGAPARTAAAARRAQRRQARRRRAASPPRPSDHGTHARFPAVAPGELRRGRRAAGRRSGRAAAGRRHRPAAQPAPRPRSADAAGRPGRACKAPTSSNSAPPDCALGAGVTLARLAADARIAQRLPALAEAARAAAGPGHRSVATLGGNLCLDTRCVFYNQSEWWRAGQ